MNILGAFILEIQHIIAKKVREMVAERGRVGWALCWFLRVDVTNHHTLSGSKQQTFIFAHF